MTDSNARHTTELMLYLSRLLHEQIKTEFSGPSLTFMQINALLCVREKKNLLTGDLAEFLAITPPSVTVLAEGLVKQGLLKRKSDVRDRRTHRLEITAIGEKLLDKRFKLISKGLNKTLGVLNSSERHELDRLLEKIIKTQNRSKK